MATPLDVSILGYLSPVVVFLLVFVLLYALLTKIKFLGDNKNFIAIIAFMSALLFLINPQAQGVVALFTPWFILLVVLVVFLFLIFLFLGIKEESIAHLMSEPGYATYLVVAVIILFLIALSQVYGQFLMVNSAPGFWNTTKRLLFHPRILGVVFLLVVASYAIKFLSETTIKK